MRPLLLLTNDDGIFAPMLGALADRLAALGDVLVVAPERPRSAASHAITLHAGTSSGTASPRKSMRRSPAPSSQASSRFMRRTSSAWRRLEAKCASS